MSHTELRFKPSYIVGDDFKGLIKDMTVTYLIEKPDNLIEFGIRYFLGLKSKRIASKDVGQSEDDDIHSDMEPMKKRNRRMSVAAEPYNPEEDDTTNEAFPKTSEQRDILVEQARKVMLFRSLDEDQFSEVIDALFEKNVKEGETVIQQGDDGDFFYIIDSGVFEASLKDKMGNVSIVKTYRDCGSFGEMALLYNVPRSATITAKTDGRLWLMNRETFRRIVVQSAFKKRRLYGLLIDQVPILSVLEPYEKLNVADALVPKMYKDGDRIIKQGDVADGMYLVEFGEVEIKVLNDSGEDVLLKTLKQGDYFGELALVTHQPRAASAFAKGPVKLAYLDVEAFERLLGPCMELMRRNMEIYEEQMKFIRRTPRNDSGILI